MNICPSGRRFQRLLISKDFEWMRRQKIDSKCLQREDDGESFTFTSGVLSLSSARCPTSVLDYMYVIVDVSLTQHCTHSGA